MSGKPNVVCSGEQTDCLRGDSVQNEAKQSAADLPVT